MGRKVWVPVVSGPLASYAAGFSSWLVPRAYSLRLRLFSKPDPCPRHRRRKIAHAFIQRRGATETPFAR